MFRGTIPCSCLGAVREAVLVRAAPGADQAIGRILAVLDEQTLLVVTSDHGGHAQTHGTEMDEDMTIPWIACGSGVPAGHALETPVSIIDNPPTIATALGAEPAKDWAGKVIGEVVGA